MFQSNSEPWKIETLKFKFETLTQLHSGNSKTRT